MSSDNQTTSRWQREISFFEDDAQKAAETTGLVDPLAVERYGNQRLKKRFDKEFRIRLLGNIQGKHILDVGCGYGGNAILLAKLGAKVTGIDISPASVELAKKRAEINGVADCVEFLCAPLEKVRFHQQSFDAVWGDNILHHLIEDLDSVMGMLLQVVKPGGVLVFSEPINLNQTLRRVRLMLPIRTDATPDERPLESQEIAIIRRHIPEIRVRFFDLFGRLNRFVLQHHNYERSSAFRRLTWNVIAVVDSVLLSIPGLRRLAGQAVFWGYVDKR